MSESPFTITHGCHSDIGDDVVDFESLFWDEEKYEEEEGEGRDCGESNEE